MSDEKAMAIAEKADLVLNGYAVSETNMDDVESAIAIRIVSENRRYITAA